MHLPTSPQVTYLTCHASCSSPHLPHLTSPVKIYNRIIRCGFCLTSRDNASDFRTKRYVRWRSFQSQLSVYQLFHCFASHSPLPLLLHLPGVLQGKLCAIPHCLSLCFDLLRPASAVTCFTSHDAAASFYLCCLVRV